MEEGELFEELVWNCVEEILEYVSDEGVGRLWRAKGSLNIGCAELRCGWWLISTSVTAASYTTSPSTSGTTSSPPPPPPKSDLPPSVTCPSPQPPLRSPFLSYFASTTPDSPSKRARVKTLLLLQSLREGRKLVKDIQDRITKGGWDRILGLEMAVLHSKVCHASCFCTLVFTNTGLRDNRSPPHGLLLRHCTLCGTRRRPSRMRYAVA